MRILIFIAISFCIFLSTTISKAEIIFLSDRDGNAPTQVRESDVYVMNDYGGNLRRLTTDLIYKIDPVWSPDGSQIVYAIELIQAGGKEWEPQQTVELFRMQADGSRQRQITDFKHLAVHPTWSPDGRSIAFVSSHTGNFEIHIMDLASGDISQLTNSLAESGGYASFSDWSPDGKKIVYSLALPGAGRHIYIIDINGRNPRPLVKDKQQELGLIHYNTGAKWHPDNQRILYRTAKLRVEHKGDLQIIKLADTWKFVIRREGVRGSETLKIPDDLIFHGGSWMDNGRAVLFSASKQGDPPQETDIYRYDIDTHKVTNLTNYPGKDFLADWVEPTYSVSTLGKFTTQWANLKQRK